MPVWLKELLAWLKDNAAWLVSAWAVWIAVRGKTFDARRAYSEFVLKQRIDAAGRLMQACARHVQALSELTAARDRLHAEPDPVSKLRLIEQMSPVHKAALGTQSALTDAMAAALPFFSGQLMAATNDVVAFHLALTARPSEAPFNAPVAQLALTRLREVINEELDVDGVIEYQATLFRRPWWRKKKPKPERNPSFTAKVNFADSEKPPLDRP